MKHTVFVSHAARDRELIAPLVKTLRSLTRGWHRLSPLRVYVDYDSTPAANSLPSELRRVLQETSCFVLVASPAAAASRWVRDEVDWWLQYQQDDSKRRVFLVLVDGELVWDRDRAGFAPVASTALPRQLLQGYFAEEPKYVDVRWARGRGVSGKDPEWASAVAELAAGLLGKTKDEVIGEERNSRQTATRILAGVSVMLLGLLALSVVLFSMARAAATAEREARRLSEAAERQAQHAEAIAHREERRAKGRLLALQSGAALDRGEYDVALLLAMEAWTRFDSQEGARSLVTALTREPRLTTMLRHPDVDRSNDNSGKGNGADPLAFSSDGARLACGHDDGQVHIWDLRTKTLTRTTRGETGAPVIALKFDRQDQQLIVIDARQLWRFEIERGVRTGPPLDHAPRTSVEKIARIADDAKIAVTKSGYAVQLWDLPNWRPLGEPLFRSVDVAGVAFSPDARQLVIVGWNGRSELWDVRSRQKISTAPSARNVALSSVAISPDGRQVVAGARHFDIWPLPNFGRMDKKMRGGHSHRSNMSALEFDQRGRIVSADLDGTVQYWDPKSLSPTGKVFQHPAPVQTIALGSSRTLATSSGQAIALWDTERKHRLGTAVRPDQEFWSLAFEPDGKGLLLAVQSGALLRYDLLKNSFEDSPLQLFDKGESIYRMAFSPNGKVLAMAASRFAALWNHQEQDSIGVVVRPEALQLTDIAFAPGSDRIALTGLDGTVSVHAIDDQRTLAMLKELKPAGRAVAIDPSGELLAAGNGRGSIALWSIAAQHLLAHVENATAGKPVLALQFTTSLPLRLQAVDGSGRVTEWDPWNPWVPVSTHESDMPIEVESAAFDETHTRIALLIQSVDAMYARSGAILRILDRSTFRAVDLRTELVLPMPSWGLVGFSPDGRRVAAASNYEALVFDLDERSWGQQACAIANRNLSHHEWDIYLPGESYQATCPELNPRALSSCSSVHSPPCP